MFVDLKLEQDSNLPLRHGWGGGVGGLEVAERLTGVSLTNPLPEKKKKQPSRDACTASRRISIGGAAPSGRRKEGR